MCLPTRRSRARTHRNFFSKAPGLLEKELYGENISNDSIFIGYLNSFKFVYVVVVVIGGLATLFRLLF